MFLLKSLVFLCCDGVATEEARGEEQYLSDWCLGVEAPITMTGA
jgi:hypothetical protein